MIGHYDFGLKPTCRSIGTARSIIAYNARQFAIRTSCNQGHPAVTSAALGWTNKATGGYAAYAKPANLPYLNPFCDPTAYTCYTIRARSTTSPAGATGSDADQHCTRRASISTVRCSICPAGTVRAAVGATTTTIYTNIYRCLELQPADAEPELILRSGEAERVGRLRPVEHPDLRRNERDSAVQEVGTRSGSGVTTSTATSAAPPIRRWRSTGSRSRPDLPRHLGHVVPGAGLPGNLALGATSPSTPQNIAAGAIRATPSAWSAPAASRWRVGGGAEVNPTCDPALLYPGRHFGPEQRRRRRCNHPAAAVPGVGPEKATNWGLGFEYVPTGFPAGSRLQATYYKIHISGVLQPFVRECARPSTIRTISSPSSRRPRRARRRFNRYVDNPDRLSVGAAFPPAARPTSAGSMTARCVMPVTSSRTASTSTAVTIGT